jgi:hypothetical protein
VSGWRLDEGQDEVAMVLMQRSMWMRQPETMRYVVLEAVQRQQANSRWQAQYEAGLSYGMQARQQRLLSRGDFELQWYSLPLLMLEAYRRGRA